MAYEKQTWIDHFVDDEGEVVQQGTAMDALHFNHMEEGIYAANDHADKIDNPHKVTAAQLGFGSIIFYDEEGYLCVKDSDDEQSDSGEQLEGDGGQSDGEDGQLEAGSGESPDAGEEQPDDGDVVD